VSTPPDEPRVEEEREEAIREPGLEELMDVEPLPEQAAGSGGKARALLGRLRARQPEVERASPARAHWALRALLIVNLALMGIVLALPSGSQPEEHEPEHRDAADPFLLPPRTLGGMPSGKYWDAAVQSAGKGDLAQAVKLLEQYLQVAPAITDVERRLVYNQIAYYLAKDGRTAQALEYERRSSQLMSRSHLPEDLLQSAHRAAAEGKVAEMRAAYARFLLQQKQIPPSLRKHVAEAYLRLGDSYRMEAEAGDVKPPAPGTEGSGKEKEHR
jgi:hypothetical protein